MNGADGGDRDAGEPWYERPSGKLSRATNREKYLGKRDRP